MFHTTHWSQLAQATLEGEASGREALAALCRDYRPAVLSHVRWRGFDQEESEDVTQEFFLTLLHSRAWQRADRTRGRFRTFLLGMVEHVIAHRAERARALKRGGDQAPVSLDELLEKGMDPPAAGEDMVRAFDRQWAAGIVGRALEAVTGQWEGEGRAADLAALRGFPAGRRRGNVLRGGGPGAWAFVSGGQVGHPSPAAAVPLRTAGRRGPHRQHPGRDRRGASLSAPRPGAVRGNQPPEKSPHFPGEFPQPFLKKPEES